MKKVFIPVILASLLLNLMIIGWPLAQAEISSGPLTFMMIHFEVGEADFPWYDDIVEGSDNTNLKYQEALWPTAVKLIDLADKYGVKLTLCFTPQWAEYILKDEKKTDIIKQWQNSGHEIAFQHHGYDHPDWSGYSNRTEAVYSPRYRGNVQKGFDYIENLIYPNEVITGTVTDTIIDLPDRLSIITYGGLKDDRAYVGDAITKPRKITDKNREITLISHGFLEKKELLPAFKQKYEEAKPDEIFGVVTHCHDFHREGPSLLEEWFKFILSKGNNIQTVKQIIKIYDN